MPDKDGPQTAIEILSLCKSSGSKAPFICCATSYTEESYNTNAIKSGMRAFINKPVSIKDLEEIIKKAQLKDCWKFVATNEYNTIFYE